jgi:hypothetical protein
MRGSGVGGQAPVKIWDQRRPAQLGKRSSVICLGVGAAPQDAATKARSTGRGASAALEDAAVKIRSMGRRQRWSGVGEDRGIGRRMTG